MVSANEQRSEVCMPEEQKSTAFQTALIGLIGTILAACGGVFGALVTSAVTVYQVQRQSQQVALPAFEGGKTLNVDTSSIFITREKAAALDSAIYYVDLERGFVLHRPYSGWNNLEEMTVQEQLAEDNVTCQAFCDQAVYRIRYGDPIEIESDQATTVNGHPIPEQLLNMIKTLYGSPPWKMPYYSQMILNVFEKSEVQKVGIITLPDMILLMTNYSAGRINRVIARADSHFAIVQLSRTYDGIRIDGDSETITTDTWLLFAEEDNAFYTIEIRYTPQSGQPLQVWDELQLYLNQFRVIQ
jgi:hypothetical protein